MTNRIKDLREDMDLRQSDLAEKTGIDQRTISNYETGKTLPDAYALIRLADFFNVSVDYLLGRVNQDSSGVGRIKKILNEIYKQKRTVFTVRFCYSISKFPLPVSTSKRQKSCPAIT